MMPFCCCPNEGKPCILNGERVIIHNSGCQVHTLESPYIEQPGETMREPRADRHRYTSHVVKEDS